MSSFTPGPWVLDGPCQFANPDKGAMVYAQRGEHGNGHLVATVEYEYSDSQKANARLIAAAPDLLQALKRTSEILFAEYGPKIYRANFMFIEEAIKKAQSEA